MSPGKLAGVASVGSVGSPQNFRVDDDRRRQLSLGTIRWSAIRHIYEDAPEWIVQRSGIGTGISSERISKPTFSGKNYPPRFYVTCITTLSDRSAPMSRQTSCSKLTPLIH